MFHHHAEELQDTKTHPGWLNDFVSLTRCDSFHLANDHTCFQTNFCQTVVTKAYAETKQNPQWVVAMVQKLEASEKNGTWSLGQLDVNK